MKHKPIRVDWDELEVAFNNQNDELVYYLDLVTGHVAIEGEGEEGDFDDEDERPPVPTRGVDSTRGYIQPVDQSIKLGWMKDFLEGNSELDAEVAGRLTEALGAENAAEQLGDILKENAEARDQWYVYRSDRTHDLIERWLEEAEVVAVDPPPWK